MRWFHSGASGFQSCHRSARNLTWRLGLPEANGPKTSERQPTRFAASQPGSGVGSLACVAFVNSIGTFNSGYQSGECPGFTGYHRAWVRDYVGQVQLVGKRQRDYLKWSDKQEGLPKPYNMGARRLHQSDKNNCKDFVFHPTSKRAAASRQRLVRVVRRTEQIRNFGCA
jgi:hypothetical protein